MQRDEAFQGLSYGLSILLSGVHGFFRLKSSKQKGGSIWISVERHQIGQVGQSLRAAHWDHFKSSTRRPKVLTVLICGAVSVFGKGAEGGLRFFADFSTLLVRGYQSSSFWLLCS